MPRIVAIKVSDAGETLAHPSVQPGQHGRLGIYHITDVPEHVDAAQVLVAFRFTAFVQRFTARFDELGPGRILRGQRA
jgi:hypothetical protein